MATASIRCLCETTKQTKLCFAKVWTWNNHKFGPNDRYPIELVIACHLMGVTNRLSGAWTYSSKCLRASKFKNAAEKGQAPKARRVIRQSLHSY